MSLNLSSAGGPHGVPADDLSSLSRLCSAPADVFAARIWSQQAWFSHAKDLSGQVHELFGVEAVDELLSRRGLRTPFLRLAKNGRVVPTSEFTGSGGIGAKVADQVLDDSVLSQFADGTTVVLQGLHRTWKPVGDLAAGLADELGHPVQVNSYITPPQSQGFAAHYDTHDVFVLQIAGSKQWRVHEPVLEQPLPVESWDTVADAVGARAEDQPILEEVLEPGDCLYLPRGFIHSATALGGTSVHLTFGVHPVIERDVLRTVLQIVETPGWRRSMASGWEPDSPDGEAAIQSVVHNLIAALGVVDTRAVANTLHDRRGAQQRPEPIAPLAQAEFAANLRADDVVRLRAHLNARFESEPDGTCALIFGGQRLAIPAAETPAMETLLAGHPVVVGELLDEPAAASQLARRLLREGVLVTAR